MANIAAFCDDGFQGRVYPHQRDKLREYFCLNPWPDSEIVNTIAEEVGVPEFVVFNYFNFARSLQKQPTNTLSQLSQDGISASKTKKLERYRPNYSPQLSFQHEANIAISRDHCGADHEIHTDRSKAEDMDIMLKEMLEPPPSFDKSKVTNIQPCESYNYIKSSQEDWMGGFVEETAPIDQTTKICSDAKVPEKNHQYITSMPTNQPIFPYEFNQFKDPEVRPESNFYTPELDSTVMYNTTPSPFCFNNQVPVLPLQHGYFDPHEVNSTAEFTNATSTINSLADPKFSTVSINVFDQEILPDLPSSSGILSDSFSEHDMGKASGSNSHSMHFHESLLHYNSQNEMSLPRLAFEDRILKRSYLPNKDDLTSLVCSEALQSRTLKPVDESGDKSTPLAMLSHQNSSPDKPESEIIRKLLDPISLAQDQMPKKRNTRCRSCSPCRASDCGMCMYCLDKPKFGGPNRRKNACIHRKCVNIIPVKRRNQSKSTSTYKKKAAIDDKELVARKTRDVVPPDQVNLGNDVGDPKVNIIMQVRYSSNGSTPIKRMASENVLDYTKLNMVNANIVESGSLGSVIKRSTVSNVEDILNDQFKDAEDKVVESTCDSKSIQYQKFDETVKKVRKIFFESEQGKFLLKEKLFAVEFDHSYAGNTQCFDGYGELNAGKDFDNNEFDESFDIGDFYDENINEKHKNAIDLGNCSYLIEDVGELGNEVFIDGIVPFDIDGKERFAASTIVHNSELGVEDNVEFNGNQISPNIRHTIISDADRKYLSTEEHCDKLDSFDIKEIAVHLSDGGGGTCSDTVSTDSNTTFPDTRTEFNSANVVDASNHLVLECVEDVVVRPNCMEEEITPTPIMYGEKDYCKKSVDEKEDVSMGSSGQTSQFESITPLYCCPKHQSENSNCCDHKVITFEFLVNQSNYFKTRPSMLKMWRSRDQKLKVDKNLPKGWRTKVYKRKSGRLDIHYISPENLDIRSKRGVMEYLKLTNDYSEEVVNRVAEYLNVSVDPL